MTDHVLLAPRVAEGPWELLSRGAKGVRAFDDLTEVAELVDEGEKLWLVLSGEGAITRSLPLAMRSARDVVRAAGLALEDQQAIPDTELFVAFSSLQDGQRLIVGLPREQVADVLAAAEAAGLAPDVITADHALLKPSEDGAVVWARGDLHAVRLVEGGLTAEPAFLDVALSDEQRAGSKVIGDDSILDLMDLEPPNFRRGPFVKRRPLPEFSAFRLSASLALAASVIFLFGVLIEGNRYAQQASDMRDRVEAEFREAFPGTPIVDLERQIRSRTNNDADDGVFLPMTAALADVLVDREDTQLTSLRYNSEGELAVELRFQEFSGLEDLRDALFDRGIATREGGDARREDEAYVTQLYLRAT